MHTCKHLYTFFIRSFPQTYEKKNKEKGKNDAGRGLC